MVGRRDLCSIGSRFLAKQSASSFSWKKLCFSTKCPDPPVPRKCSFVQPPLTKPLPGLPQAVYASLAKDRRVCVVDTLDGGLRVTSEERYGQFCTVGVIVESGSRFEVSYPSGVSHFLEKLAFGTTVEYPEKDQIRSELQKYGGIYDCLSARDVFIYALSIDRRGLNVAMKILAEVVCRPRITVAEVEEAREAVRFEVENLSGRPDQEIMLMDMIHAAAYKDNTLGLPKICPEENINVIDRHILYTYLKQHYRPDRMVIAGVGVDHRSLLQSVEDHFLPRNPIWQLESGLALSQHPFFLDASIAQFTGDMIKEVCSIPTHYGLPELAHVAIGLESMSHREEDFIPTCILNVMMGGGSSFSAGGPGKGMFTRLYTNVLYRYHWINSAIAYNHAYTDTGIFCIYASAPPEFTSELVKVMVHELTNMPLSISQMELQRAKVQLKSMLLMNLESRPVVFEDVCRQVLSTGQRKKSEYFIEKIDKIGCDDIVRVAKRLLCSPPAVAARGGVKDLQSLKDIQAALSHPHGKFPNQMEKFLDKFQ